MLLAGELKARAPLVTSRAAARAFAALRTSMVFKDTPNPKGLPLQAELPGTEADALPEPWGAAVWFCLRSTFLWVKHPVDQMLRQGGGAIGRTVSLAGTPVTRYGSPVQDAAKASMIQVTRRAAVDCTINGGWNAR